jgi:Protein of unknown function (DUF3995)
MSTIATLEAGLLVAISALHVAWGFGVRWPRRDEQALAALVVGYNRNRMPPPLQCFVAAGAILAAGVVVALVAGSVHLPIAPALVTLAGVGGTAVFAGRGVAGYLPAWRARFPRQPFATLDRRIYSPLCLAIAATCAVLLSNHMEN